MPIDLLAAEWFLKLEKGAKKILKQRVMYANRYNLMTHIGYKSTFSDREQRRDAGCGDPLKVRFVLHYYVP
jgi:hypothetical protein